MEKWGKPKRYEQPASFSSTLLDAIYKSMDESDCTSTGTESHSYRTAKPSQNHASKRDPSTLLTHQDYDRYHYHSHQQKLSVRTRPAEPARRHVSGGWTHSTSSSSDCSSYGGFSSSEAESVRLRPIRTGSKPDLAHSHSHYKIQSPSSFSSDGNKKKSSNNSVKNRIKEFRKSGSKNQTPASPGARLAGFLNAIFAKKGQKSGDPAGLRRTPAEEERSACSTATRSCLSKTPSTAKRSVRFCAVDDVSIYVREREEQEESDESDDLFELDDLTVGIGRRFRDELPVYGTTSLGNNKGASRSGFSVHGTPGLGDNKGACRSSYGPRYTGSRRE